ncbi:MAG TPA: YgiQ family radical SAM protein [Bacteroidales bacterium]|nr:YgiQ family radical SAM protein [Bacteroidales bacterium]
MEFPTSKKELERLGWDYIDVILITGDAYIDHPSFGVAIIARVLQKLGYKVAIVPQPNWRDDLRDFKKLGAPRLFFGISAGSMDSMVNHYTATKRLRSDDAYTPGGLAGQRPDYACIVYANIVRQLYPSTPIVLGGIEASLRRFAHYDYWSDRVKQSILLESKADLLVYGMGEQAITDIAIQLDNGIPVQNIRSAPQTAYSVSSQLDLPNNCIELHSYEECSTNKKAYAENFKIIEEQSNSWKAQKIAQKIGDRYVVVNEPYELYTEAELDAIYALPYTRQPHSRYAKKPPIPAFEMIKHSVTMHRGCFGGCSFCTISAHQGKFVVSRSKQSILQELSDISSMPYFKGHITDLGGPSANMYRMQGKNLELCRVCKRASCLFPAKCKNLNDDHCHLIALYKESVQIPGIKHVTIGSGIRLDLLQGSKTEREYTSLLLQKHVSGRLKVAPEHTEPEVLSLMRKPPFASFEAFKKVFDEHNAQFGLRQQLIPYFISSHPGCSAQDMKHLSNQLRNLQLMPEQVQDFTPTPMTLATVMYYTGLNPYTGKPLFSAKTKAEKDAQKSSFFWYTQKGYRK